MLNELQKTKLALSAQELIDLWQQFIEMHTDLYAITCEEYNLLLESNIEGIDEKLEEKSELMERISLVNNKREELLAHYSEYKEGTSFEKINDVIDLFTENEILEPAKHILRLNSLLLDIVLNIQEQNKKNQIFLNRALISLKDLKESFIGKKNYKTYGSNGTTKSNVAP